MSLSRCWGCCQENCVYTQCSCDCHGMNERALEAVRRRRKDPPVISVVPESDRAICDTPVTGCGACGALGAHFCIGRPNKREIAERKRRSREWREIARQIVKQYEHATGQCPDHRRYQGKRKPRTACEGCWRIWIALNPR